MDDLSRFCCQNSQCPDYGQRAAANLTVCMRYGKHQHLRLLYCRSCHARFSERKGTPLFQARLPDDKCLSILEHIAEGCGVRKTSRLVGVNRSTVTRYAVLAAIMPDIAQRTGGVFPHKHVRSSSMRSGLCR